MAISATLTLGLILPLTLLVAVLAKNGHREVWKLFGGITEETKASPACVLLVAWGMVLGVRKIYLNIKKPDGDGVLSWVAAIAPITVMIAAVAEKLSVGSVGPITWYEFSCGVLLALGMYMIDQHFFGHFTIHELHSLNKVIAKTKDRPSTKK